MTCVFQNIDPPPPSPPPLLLGEDTLAGRRGGGGVNILEDARHSSVLFLYRILFASSTSSVHSILTRAEFAKQKREINIYHTVNFLCDFDAKIPNIETNNPNHHSAWLTVSDIFRPITSHLVATYRGKKISAL
jgi:hypothetical protein